MAANERSKPKEIGSHLIYSLDGWVENSAVVSGHDASLVDRRSVSLLTSATGDCLIDLGRGDSNFDVNSSSTHVTPYSDSSQQEVVVDDSPLDDLVLGLWSILVVGRAPAQEAAGQAAAPATAAGRTDWQAEGTQGAVAAGGRDAVAAGLEILKKGGNAADCGRRDDPGFERHGFAVVLLRRRGADPGL